MAMEIINNYSRIYESTYAAQRQQATKKEETKEMSATQKNTGATTSNSDYFSKLAKLVPSVDCKIGNTYSSAKSGKTLTINPKLLEKMQNDSELEKEMNELIKGVEAMTRLSESINKATGRTTVYQHSYIDENGKFHSSAVVVKKDELNERLRKEAQENAEKQIEKTRENTRKKAEQLAEQLEEKAEEAKKSKKKQEKAETVKNKAETLLLEKIESAKDGNVILDDEDMQTIIKAVKEDNRGKVDTKKPVSAETNFDIQV